MGFFFFAAARPQPCNTRRMPFRDSVLFLSRRPNCKHTSALADIGAPGGLNADLLPSLTHNHVFTGVH
jgi:hypothetical protein